MKVLQQLFASFFIIFYAFTTAALPITAFAQTTVGSGTITATPPSGIVPLVVSFKATWLDVTKTYTVNFGDGASATANPQCGLDTTSSQKTGCIITVSHTYTKAGPYIASVGGYSTHVTVNPVTFGKTPPTCNINVNPSSISVGGSVTVTWQSTNATAGAITNIGNVGPSGSINLLPSSNSITTYFGAFTGPGGTSNCQASVAVNSATNGGNLNDTPSTDLTNTAVTNTPTALGVSSPSSQGSSGLVPCGYGTFTGNTGRDPTASTGCQACDLATLIQNIINFAIGIAIPIAAALMAYAGVLMFTGGDNPGRITKAKGIFKDAFIGFLIAITAWLLINTLLHIIFSQGTFSSGNWFTIQCAAQPRPVNGKITDVLSQLPIIAGNTGAIQPDGSGVTAGSNPTGAGSDGSGGTTPGSTNDGTCNSGYSLQIYEDGSSMCVDSTGTNIQNPTCANGSTLNSNNQCFVDYTSNGPGVSCPSGSVYLPDGGTCADANGNLIEPLPVAVGPGNGGNIAAAALAYQGSNTSAGPDGGNLACAWAVNNVLALSGIPPVDGNSVDQMETVLEKGRGTEVTPATAQAGDIVIENNDTMSHVGICFDPTGGTGCPQVLSNSSSKATFSNISDITMGTGITPTIYRINK